MKKVRKDNPIALTPPAIVEQVFSRKVQRGGQVSIGACLRQGTRVNLLQINETTLILSSLPPEEVQKLGKYIPVPASPYAALSARIRGQRFADEERIRSGRQDVVPSGPSDDAVLRGANLTRTRRKR